MKDNVKVGVIQMKIINDIFDESIRKKNVQKAIEMVKEAAEKELDLIVLPEEFYAGSGYGPISLPDDIGVVKENVIVPLEEIAKKYNVNIIGALTVKLNKNAFQNNNIAFVIDREGKLLGYQERIHKTPAEDPFSFAGTELKIFDLDIGKIGIIIGMDIMYPEIARNFVISGCEILVSPMLAPGQVGNDNKNFFMFPNNMYMFSSISRALENQVYVITANGVGDFAHADLKLFGASSVIGPKGIIMQLDNNEGIGITKIDINDKVSATQNFPIWDMRDEKICLIK